VSKNYQSSEADTSRLAVPETVNVAMSEIAEDVQEGLLALAVGTGLQVMTAMMNAMSRACAARRASTSRAGPVCGTAPGHDSNGFQESNMHSIMRVAC